MLSHFVCQWDHDGPDDPVLLYEEVDEARNEVRKVHEYRDGRLIRTDRISDLNDSLASEPLPRLDEIRVQPEFTVQPLTAAEFDAVWARATDAR